MASGPPRVVALLSIHPEHADAILSGSKRVEFRRRGPSSDITDVIVYATAPISKVVGWFTVDSVDSDSPSALWRRHWRTGGIDRSTFNAYYLDCAIGSAIQVEHAETLRLPVDLASLDANLRAPQSYRYVDEEILASVQRQPSLNA